MESATYEPGVPRSGAASAPGPFRAGDPPRCPRERGGGLSEERLGRAGDTGSPAGPGAPAPEERRHGIRDLRTRCSPQRRRLGARPVPRRRPPAMSPGARRRAAGERLSDGRRRRFVARTRCAGFGGRASGPNPRPTDPVFPAAAPPRRPLVPRRRPPAMSPGARRRAAGERLSDGRRRRFVARTRCAGFGGRASGPNPRPTDPVFPAAAPPRRPARSAPATPREVPEGAGGGLPEERLGRAGTPVRRPDPGRRIRRTGVGTESATDCTVLRRLRIRLVPRRRRVAGGGSRGVGARVSPSRPGAPAAEERRHGIRGRRGRCSPHSAPSPGRAPGLHSFRAVESAPGRRGRGAGRRPG